MANKIPILDLTPEINALYPAFAAALERVVRSGRFILGPEGEAFEKEAAALLGAKHAIGVSSGTDALVVALRALGIGPGDQVITTPFTFVATAEAISLVGGEVVLVDIEEGTLNIDVAEVAKAITPRTKGLLPVHLFGHAARMDELLALAKDHNLKVLEDTAQAFGGTYRGKRLGTLGDMGAFSFFPSKNLGSFGDAGLITTNDQALADSARLLRTHGSRAKYFNEVIGYNARLDELQAAILRVKLPYVDARNEARRAVAAYYQQKLPALGVVVPVQEPYAHHVYHQFTVRLPGVDRDLVNQAMAQQGVSTMIYYPRPLHQLPVYQHLGGKFPQAEQASREVLSLPIWPEMDRATQDQVIAALAQALTQARQAAPARR